MAVRRAFRNMPKNPAELDRLFRDVQVDHGDIENAQLRDSIALSVIGRSASSAGSPADIQASANGHYLRRSGDVLGFGAIDDSDIPAGIARDAEVASSISTAIANHEAALDPHPVYTTTAELVAAIAALNLTSGTYTPTLTIVANADAVTAYESQYLRVGDTVTVSGALDIDPTAATADTRVGISLPIASNLGDPVDCSGTLAAYEINSSGAIRGDAANNRAEARFLSQVTANRTYHYFFSYQVI